MISEYVYNYSYITITWILIVLSFYFLVIANCTDKIEDTKASEEINLENKDTCEKNKSLAYICNEEKYTISNIFTDSSDIIKLPILLVPGEEYRNMTNDDTNSAFPQVSVVNSSNYQSSHISTSGGDEMAECDVTPIIDGGNSFDQKCLEYEEETVVDAEIVSDLSLNNRSSLMTDLDDMIINCPIPESQSVIEVIEEGFEEIVDESDFTTEASIYLPYTMTTIIDPPMKKG